MNLRMSLKAYDYMTLARAYKRYSIFEIKYVEVNGPQEAETHRHAIVI